MPYKATLFIPAHLLEWWSDDGENGRSWCFDGFFLLAIIQWFLFMLSSPLFHHRAVGRSIRRGTLISAGLDQLSITHTSSHQEFPSHGEWPKRPCVAFLYCFYRRVRMLCAAITGNLIKQTTRWERGAKRRCWKLLTDSMSSSYASQITRKRDRAKEASGVPRSNSGLSIGSSIFVVALIAEMLARMPFSFSSS